jgi:hypothetical protein
MMPTHNTNKIFNQVILPSVLLEYSGCRFAISRSRNIFLMNTANWQVERTGPSIQFCKTDRFTNFIDGFLKRKKGIITLILIASLSSNLASVSQVMAQDVRSFAGEFDVEKALKLVYGDLIWSDKILKQFENFKDSDEARICSVFDASFKEQHVEKHVVIAALTPNVEYYGCHACWPLLGGAVFRNDGEQWSIESESKVLEPGNGWGDKFSLVKTGQDQHGVVHLVEDVHQGYEDKVASIFFPLEGQLFAQKFSTAITGTPGSGACEVPDQHLRLSFTDGKMLPLRLYENYYEIVVDEQWNEGKCSEIETGVDVEFLFIGRVCHNISRYRFNKSEYQLLVTHLNGCVDWHVLKKP